MGDSEKDMAYVNCTERLVNGDLGDLHCEQVRGRLNRGFLVAFAGSQVSKVLIVGLLLMVLLPVYLDDNNNNDNDSNGNEEEEGGMGLQGNQ